MFRGYALVAFLDLLGFSARVRDDWDTDNDPLETLLQLKDTVRAHRADPLIVTLKSGDARIRPELIRKIHSVSDSIIIAIGIPNSHEEVPFEVIYAATLELCINVNIFLEAASKAGYAVRGGVEAGQIFWDADDFVGPTWNVAYLIESKCAKSVRVVCGPQMIGIVQHLHEHQATFATDMFRLSSDKLLCLMPTGISDAQLEQLREASPEHLRWKYEGCLQLRASECNLTAPDLEKARQKIVHQLSDNGWHYLQYYGITPPEPD